MLRSVLHRDQQSVAGVAEFMQRGPDIEFVVFGGGKQRIDYFQRNGDVDVLLFLAGAAHVHNQVAVRLGDADVLVLLLHGYKFVVRRGADGVEQTLHVNSVQVRLIDGHVAVAQFSLIHGWQDLFGDRQRQIHVDALALLGVFDFHMQIALRRRRS